MSGILAAAQSSGCCCRPQEGCTCSDPNRPGAIIDRGLSSVAVDCDMSLEDSERNNSCSDFGCSCPCSAEPTYGNPGGIQYGYQTNGSIVDPDFAEDTECESLICRAGCCGGCPIYRCRSDFGTGIAEQVTPGFAVWSSVTTAVFDNVVGTWNWQPQQVGYCTREGVPLVRIRKYCPFSYGGGLPGGPIDPNGQYLNMDGSYTGANIGLLRAYRACEVSGCCGLGIEGDQDCSYRVRIAIGYLFQYELQDIFGNSVGGVMRGIPLRFFINGIVADYAKRCQSPADTVFGTYTRIGVPEYNYAEEDQECGRIRFFRERLAAFPNTLTVS